MLNRAYELRYQVYCLERGFLSPKSYPNGREFDQHDDESAHFGAYHRGDELVGYVRLVQPTEGPFPFQHHCAGLLRDIGLPSARESAEVSRLMLRKEYRAQRHDQQQPGEVGSILLQLYRRMYLYSIENDLRYWYAAMEKSLARQLQRSSFMFKQISPETDYYGPVALYLADLRDIEAQLARRNPRLLEWLREPEATGLDAAASTWQIRHLPRPSVRSAHRERLHPPLNGLQRRSSGQSHAAAA